MPGELPPITGSTQSRLGYLTLQAHVQVRSPLPDDHPYYAAIGKVTASWGQFEYTVNLCIWEILGIDHQTASVQTSSIIGPRKRFERLCKELTDRGYDIALSDMAAALGNRASAVAHERNAVTHDPWFIDGEENVSQLASENPRREIQFGWKEVSAEQITVLGHRVDELTYDARVLLTHIVSERANQIRASAV